MLANNVQETTSTAGTGNITLTGSSDNGRTFSSQFAINRRFTYFIDDGAGNFETGVGYLSNATTLVRENPQDGSATLPVNFAAGEKQVFISPSLFNTINSFDGFSALSGTVKFMPSYSMGRLNSTEVIVANRQYFFDAVFLRTTTINLMGAYITTGGGTSSDKMHVGLYDIDSSTGLAGNLICEATNLDPSSAGFVSGSTNEIVIPAGVYQFSVWSSVNTTLRANDTSIRSPNVFCSTSVGFSSGHCFESDLTGLTSLPATANPTTNNTNGRLVFLVIGHT